MSNVFPLFPNATDEQWEDHMMPALIKAMERLWTAASAGDHETLCEISVPLLAYVRYSMETLDAHRRAGTFDDNKLPANVAYAFNNLMADYARACGGEDSFVSKLRTRS